MSVGFGASRFSSADGRGAEPAVITVRPAVLVVAANMSVFLLVLVSITTVTCLSSSDTDAVKSGVYAETADMKELQVTHKPECEHGIDAGESQRKTTEPRAGGNINFINAIARFLQSNDTEDDSLENYIDLLSDYLVTDYLSGADDGNKTITAVTARMKMSDFMFNPFMFVPQLIMMGFAPILLANLKMLVMNALMINNMALSSAIFMTVRNIVFGPKLGGQTKYVNYGYRKPSGHKYHKYHHHHHY